MVYINKNLLVFVFAISQLHHAVLPYQPAGAFSRSRRPFKSRLFYRIEPSIVEVETKKTRASNNVSCHKEDLQQTAQPAVVSKKISPAQDRALKMGKPIITKIESLTEFEYFLDEDKDRLVAVKFYAPWCKKCQKLGLHYDKLAKKMGDVIIDRKKIQGKVRFASIEYNEDESKKELIVERLKVQKIPTLQLYFGQHKIWEASGSKTTTKELELQIAQLTNLSIDEVQDLAIDRDDGILRDAIEDSFFENPYEEW